MKRKVYVTVNDTGRRARRRDRRRERRASRIHERDGESAARRWLRANSRSAILRVGKNLRPWLNGFLARYAVLGDPPVYDPAVLPFTGLLEANWESIRKEAELVMTSRDMTPPLNEISPDHDRIAEDERWRVYFLKGYGYWQPVNCDRCPETYRLVRDIPGIESAFFSILEAGCGIKRHKGPTKSIMTAHLGLLIPKDSDNCFIEVAKGRHHWHAGKMFVFDDTFKHSVTNDTDEERVVLLLHVRRPMRFPGSVVSDLFFGAIKHSPFVRDGARNQKRWEERHARAEGL